MGLRPGKTKGPWVGINPIAALLTGVANVGTGAGLVFRDLVAGIINLKTIKAGSNITVTNNADDITIANSKPENTTVLNVGGGAGQVYRDKTVDQINLKTLLAGAGISVTNNADDITVAATGGAPSFQEGSGIQIYPLTGGITAVSANHSFTFDNRYTQSFWSGKPVFTSLDWDLSVGVGLRGLAANNASNAIKTGIRSEFDILIYAIANNANPVGIIATGNGITAQLKIDSANNITASFTGNPDTVIAAGAAAMFLRIKQEERNHVSFYYRSASGDPWIPIVSYLTANFQDNITLSLLSSAVIGGVYNYIRELTLNIGEDCDPTVFGLTDGANIAVDASRGNNFAVTLGGNRTLSAPTNPRGDGQIIRLRFTQDGTGGRTLAFNAIYQFQTETPVLQTAIGATDILSFMYNATTVKWHFLSKSVPTTVVTTLVDAATIAVDASKGFNYQVTLAGNRTLGAPTNPLGDGQIINVRFIQDGTGGRTLAFNAIYVFQTETPVLQTAIGAVDILSFMYNAAAVKWNFLSKSVPTSVMTILTDAATIAVDASKGVNYQVTLGGNRTLGAPTNPLGDGQTIDIRVIQDGTGGRTLAYNAIWRFQNETPVLQTAIAAVDILRFKYNSAATKWDYQGMSVPTSVVTTLTDAATIAVDASKGFNFMVTLGGNRTLGAPTNPLGDGHTISIRVKQDGTGNRSLLYNAIYRFPSGRSPVPDYTIAAQMILTFKYHAADVKWDFMGVNYEPPFESALTDAATIAIVAMTGPNFGVTLGGNRTLGAPTQPPGNGYRINIRVKQDGTGGRTLAYNAIYRFAHGAPVLQTKASAVDILTFEYDSVDTKWDFISLTAQTSTVVTLTDAATIAVDASSAYNSQFMVTLGDNRTLGAPTNPLGDGQVIRIRVLQDGTGGRTLAYNAIYRFPSGTPVLQTAIGALDILTFMYNVAATKWDFIAINSRTSDMVTLTDAATIAVDASLGSKFKVTLGGNRTLGNPTNPAGDGQLLLIRVTQDGTGTRTLAYDTKYRFSTALPSPTLSTAINKVDYIGFIYAKTADKWDFISWVQGFN
jgi:hypothetical protein